MALSELHNRLEHLVSYSSQLIFVSGDAIAKQQSLLESFLELQSSNTEIAFFRAPANKPLQEYRGTLCSQLLGHSAQSLARPLNELLASLNQHEGPIIISISQAEHLPDEFLQELWELVLQSRFAKNKQHLNILLFGQPEWAKRAKNWLPTRNNGKPLLLSNENVPEPSQKETDLEKLIAQKRRQFDLRLQARAEQTQQKPVNRSWLWLLAVLVFFGSFVGILAWQYAKEIENIWREFEADTQEVAATANVHSAAPATNQTEENTVNNDDLAVKEIAQSSAQTDAQVASESKTQLVTDWQTQLQAMQTPNELGKAAEAQTQADENKLQPARALVETEDFIFQEPDDVVDYPVEDIVSVDQLPARTEPETAVVETSAAQTQGSNAETQVKVEDVKLPPKPDFDEALLQALAENEAVIQIAAMADRELLQDFLSDNQLTDHVWVYQSSLNDKPWYVVLHRQSYPNAQNALNAIANLSQVKRRGTPFVKSVRQVLDDIDSALLSQQ